MLQSITLDKNHKLTLQVISVKVLRVLLEALIFLLR